MTTKRIHVCNFCQATDELGSLILGFYWVADKLEMRDAIRAENHLCESCFKAIREVRDRRYIEPPEVQ